MPVSIDVQLTQDTSDLEIYSVEPIIPTLLITNRSKFFALKPRRAASLKM
jgi:hypothetical protein